MLRWIKGRASPWVGQLSSEMAERQAVSAIRCHSWVEISKYECFKIVKTQAERDGYEGTALEINY